MILKRFDNAIKRIDGFVPVVQEEGEIIFSFRTYGTCFPVRSGIRPAQLWFYSEPGVDNAISIDYADGTGWHTYTFRGFNQDKIIRFYCGTGSNPATVSGPAVYDVKPNDGLGGGTYGIHFYQDLDNPTKINTVDHTYPQERVVRVKFAERSYIRTIRFIDAGFKGEFPSLAKIRNLEWLELSYLMTLSSFNNQALRTLLKKITLASLGFNSSVLPLWIRQSPTEELDLSDFIILNSASDFAQTVLPVKGTLKRLILNNVNINYALPDAFIQLEELVEFQSRENVFPAPDFTFPQDLSNLVNFTTLDVQGKVSFPLSQIKRFIQEVPSVQKSLNLRAWGATTTSKDIVLDADDYSVETFNGAYGRWNNGVPPTCVNQMRNLKTLIIYKPSNLTTNTALTGWGNFSNATELQTIEFYRQRYMDLTLPAWFPVLTKLKRLTVYGCFDSQEKADNFVNSVYSMVTANASMVTGNTAFRHMTLELWGSGSTTADSFRPSGTYQQPSGYVQGSQNGTADTPLKKIWVLTNQYAHTWLLPPS
jgi:hypothetical protein